MTERKTRKLPNMKKVCMEPKQEYKPEPTNGPMIKPTIVTLAVHDKIRFSSVSDCLAIVMQVACTQALAAPYTSLSVIVRIMSQAWSVPS